ncbi:YunC family protein [Peribacillus deserti]|uniref:DUF1805 domain-containing protein n=1 Tax=Peribacillus deserti TaxID=673318 RepID=A0A2N5LZJ0_9BACI|nr:DUF1805 domain-containing protein [Peribacillus deserti]PLT27485.1 DUF1805 domain-containing protein [Peribacillus deserti]
MVTLKPIIINNVTFLGVAVELPKTSLLAITSDRGYVMCGALDIGLLNERLKDRRILAGRAVGVKTLDELLEASLESVTLESERHGITKGMSVREALLKMS